MSAGLLSAVGDTERRIRSLQGEADALRRERDPDRTRIARVERDLGDARRRLAELQELLRQQGRR